MRLLLAVAAARASLLDRIRAPAPLDAPAAFIDMAASTNGTVRVPTMLYATAYKRHRTEELVARALRAGFAGVDTAHGESKRYNETAVGAALRSAAAGAATYVQLKVHHLPPPTKGAAPPSPDQAAKRVRGSLRKGLANLGLDRVDAAFLRGPSAEARRTGKLAEADVAGWRALQDEARAGRARLLGVCNFPPALLEDLARLGGPPCRLHQTRLRADRGWSAADRRAAAAAGVALQAPNLVPSHDYALRRGGALSGAAAATSASPARTLLRFALALGVTPVVGATSPAHVVDDLAAAAAGPLGKAHVARILAAHPDKGKPAGTPKRRRRSKEAMATRGSD